MIRNKAGFTIMLMMVANLLVKVFGLLREVFLADFYGTGIYTDAYIIANNIPTVLFAALGTALATTFVPMVSKIRKEKGNIYANTFTLHLLVVLCVICVIFTCVGEVFTKQIVLIFASGFKGEILEVTIAFTRILIPSVFGIAMMNLFGSYLQFHEKFAAITLVPIFGNVTIIIALWISNIYENVYFFVWGTLFGLMVQILFYIPWMWHSGIQSGTFKGIFSDEYLLPLLFLVLPVFLGEAVNEINTIIDRTLVSGLGTGSVSALNYAYKVIGIVTSVICGSITTLLYPKLSKISAEKDWKLLRLKSEDMLSIIFIILCPITVVLIGFDQDIIRLLFGRGNFGETAIERTAIALSCYATAVIGIGLRDIMVKLFCCMQDTRTPMLNGAVCAGINIILDIILIKALGYKGAALATAIVAIIGAFNLIYIAKKRDIIKLARFMPTVLKCLIGAAIAFLFMVSGHNILETVYSYGIAYIFCCGLIALGTIFIYFALQIVLRNKVLLHLIEK